MTVNASLTLAAAAVFVAALSSPLVAQWPTHRDTAVPRTANGEPNLNAPAPRTADGKPDFSGVWEGWNAGRNGGPPVEAGAPPVAGFRDAGQNLTGGLPLTPLGQELLKQRVANNSKDNPEAWCLPMGLLQFHTQGAPRKFVQTPKLLIILYEASSGIRQVFLDGRKPPASNDAQPWFYGYSVGRWEGDTLVVETTGSRDEGWLDIIGSPLTDAATITERIRRPTYGHMTIDVTTTDPKVYTKPWTVRVNQRIMPESELIEFICEENQRFGKQPQ
jgi:hypothetical protein